MRASNNKAKRNSALSQKYNKPSVRVNALVLAGGKLKDQENGYKAFLPFGNSTIVNHVLDALKNCKNVSNITVTSVPQGQSIVEDIKTLPAQNSLIESIISSLESLPEEKTILVASDIPLITSDMVDDYINACLCEEADFYYPLIPKEEVEKIFPGIRRTYFKTKEGAFTGGNILMIRNSKFANNQELAKNIYDSRKKPIKLVKILGFKFLYRFIRKSLSIVDAEARASKIIDGKAKAIITPYPEIGCDIDKQSDYDFMLGVISNERN